MAAELIDGRAYAADLARRLSTEVAELSGTGVRTGLATVLVGEGYGSLAYERRLTRLTRELGMHHVPRRLPRAITQVQLIASIEALNADPTVSGILVLRPLPSHIEESAVFRAIHPVKDIEAVHPENAGLLALGVPRYIPSTAAAAFYLLDRWLETSEPDPQTFYRRSLISVVGRSNNVGKPCVSLAYARQATVQSIDEFGARAVGLGRLTRRADVLIVAAGRPGLIRAEHLGPDAIVVDIGINPVLGADGTVHMVGDADRASVGGWARALSPVPGGVGPITDVWLVHNVIRAAQLLSGMSAASASDWPPPALPSTRHRLEQIV